MKYKYYKLENEGDFTRVQLMDERNGTLEDAGYFHVPTPSVGTEDGDHYIDREIDAIIKGDGFGRYYHSVYPRVRSFEELTEELQEKLTPHLEEATYAGIDRALKVLDELDMTADPGLDGSLDLFRFKQ